MYRELASVGMKWALSRTLLASGQCRTGITELPTCVKRVQEPCDQARRIRFLATAVFLHCFGLDGFLETAHCELAPAADCDRERCDVCSRRVCIQHTDRCRWCHVCRILSTCLLTGVLCAFVCYLWLDMFSSYTSVHPHAPKVYCATSLKDESN